MNIAIIGSNGFIGKNLVNRFIKEKKVKLFLFGTNTSSYFGNKLPYTKINLKDSSQILNHFQNIDLIYYLASSTIPASSWEAPTQEIEENLLPFINFLDCISKIGIKKIIFTSSAGTIYGSSVKKLNENSEKKPVNPYGINKLTMEYYLQYYDIRFNLKNITFRISNIYGKHQNTKNGLGVINTFLEKIISTREINVYGDGESVRNYVYIKDVAEILFEAHLNDFTTSKTYNLCSNDSLSINDIITKIKNLINIDFQVSYHPNRSSDLSTNILDNTLLKKDFKTSLTPLQKGIYETFEYLSKK